MQCATITMRGRSTTGTSTDVRSLTASFLRRPYGAKFANTEATMKRKIEATVGDQSGALDRSSRRGSGTWSERCECCHMRIRSIG